MAVWVEAKPDSRSQSTIDERLVGQFFEKNILGIIAHLAEGFDATKTLLPVSERLRNICAIEELIQLAQSRISVALPQICTCLMSSLKTDDLAHRAFRAWIAMVKVLDGGSARPLLPQTFAIIAEIYPRSLDNFQREVVLTAKELFDERKGIISDDIMYIPALNSIAPLKELASNIAAAKAGKGRLGAAPGSDRAMQR